MRRFLCRWAPRLSDACLTLEANLVEEVVYRLREIPHVIGFLGGGDPIPLRPSEVSRVLGTLDELQEQPEELDVQYYVGETVKVTYGPFNGFSGVIEEMNTDESSKRGGI